MEKASVSVPKRPVRRKVKLQDSKKIVDYENPETDSIYSITSAIIHPEPFHESTSDPSHSAQVVKDQVPVYATVQKNTTKVLKDITEENHFLRQKVEDLLQKEKRREDSCHEQLKLEVTQLETETRKEVKALSKRIHILVTEKESLKEQLDVLLEEKREFQLQVQQLQDMKEEQKKKLDLQHKQSLESIEKRHQDKIVKLKQELQMCEESQSALSMDLEESRQQLERLHTEKTDLLQRQDESVKVEHELQNTFLALLKVTESITVERDILLNKSSFQEHQQKQLHSSLLDYSLSVGRLQEHVSKLSQENHLELLKLRSHEREETMMQHSQWHQFEGLRQKILDQSSTIEHLESENRRLEMQLESLWEATCGMNTSEILEHVKNMQLVHVTPTNRAPG